LQERSKNKRHGRFRDILFLVLLFICFLQFFFSPAFAATKTWARPDGNDLNWSTDSNWSPSGKPGPTDDIIFNSSDTDNSVIDESFIVKSVSISSGYTGVVTHEYNVSSNVSLTVTTTFEQLGGTFLVGGDPTYCPLTVGDSFFVTAEATFRRYTGSGTVGSPYMIYDVYGLQAMSCNANLSLYYKLNNNINAASAASWNYNSTRATHEGFVPIGMIAGRPFTGSFDGNYKFISNLNIDEFSIGTVIDSVGMFAVVSGGSISNFSLVDSKIAGTNVRNVGGLVGYNVSSTITNCYVSAEVLSFGGGDNANLIPSKYVGVLVGNNQSGTISKSFSLGSIYRNAAGFYEGGNSFSGGLIGVNTTGTISDCYSSVGISLLTYAGVIRGGGFIGSNTSGTVSNCYSFGAILSTAYTQGVGGFAGYNSGTVSGSYFTDSNYNNYIGTLKTSDQLMKQDTFAGWDFSTIWSMDENKSYPYFLWQIYSWVGTTSGNWTVASNWNRGSGYPSSASDKVYINAGSYNVITPNTGPLTIGGLKVGPDFAYKVSLSDNITFDNSSNKSGNLILLGGTFEGNGKTVKVSGNLELSNEAKYYSTTSSVNNSGTIEFLSASVPSLIKGSNSFYNFKCVTAYKRLTFESGSVHTMDGTVVLSGEAGKELLVTGSVPGQRWYIRPNGAVTAKYLIVSDSYNLGSTINTENSYDGGNNYGWSGFSGCSVSIATNEGGVISPSGTLNQVTIPTAESRTFVVTANAGYYLGYVRIDGTFETGTVTSPHSITIYGNSGHHSIEAYFVKNNVKVWDGGAGTTYWFDDLNWTSDAHPSASDSVIFNSVCSRDADIYASVLINSLTIESTYTGKISQYNPVTLTGTYEQYGGTFECTSPNLYTMSVAGGFKISDTNASFIRFTGSGSSASDPYVIYDLYGLQAARLGLNKHYKLNNDIDASRTRAWNWNGTRYEGFAPIGYSYAFEQDVPDHPFTGTFNGNSNVISGIYINMPTMNFVGLFGAVYSASGSISDFGLDNIYVRGNCNVGGFIGKATRANLVKNVYVTGEVYSGNSGRVGGLIGAGQLYTTITRCYASVTVEAFNSGFMGVGGIVGYMPSGSVTDCYSEGTVTGGNDVGGIIGSNSSTISNCYTTATMNCVNDRVGGAIGNGPGTISNIYYTDYKSNFKLYGTHITAAQTKIKATFSGFDFDDVWSIDENITSPYLMWKNYNWRGGSGDHLWTNPNNWSKNLKKASDYPHTKNDKVYLSVTNESITMPSVSTTLEELRMASDYSAVLTLESNLLLTDESGSGGNLVVRGGKLYLSNKSVSLEGNFEKASSATLVAGTGTIELLGADRVSLLKGSKTLYNFICRTPGKIITFESGTQHTIEGQTFLSGEASVGRLIVLRGTLGSPESWYITPKGTRVANNLIVANSYNSSPDAIVVTNSFDGGNNIRWSGFSGSNVYASAGTGGTITPEGNIPLLSGQVQKFTVSSNEGYYIGFVKIDGRPTDETLSHMSVDFYLNGNLPHSIEAYFVEQGVKVWTGNGPTNKWSDPINWSGNMTPESAERVVFNSTSSKTSTIDSFNITNTIKAMSIESASSVIVYQQAPLTITSTYEQLSGRFICVDPGPCTLTIEGDFRIPTTSNPSAPSFFRLAGSGTSGSPYRIYDIYGLQGLVNLRTAIKYYLLANNIDATVTKKWNWNGTTTEGFVPIGDNSYAFYCYFNGNYYSVNNLWINRGSNLVYTGLFGRMDSSRVYGLGVTNAFVVGFNSTGILCGWMSNSFVNNCYTTGYVSGESTVGGVLGTSFGNCYFRYSYSTGEVHGNTAVGGLIGDNTFGAKIYDCYSGASVEGRSSSGYNIGGLAGTNGAPMSVIYNSYACGNVSIYGGFGSVGALIGGGGDGSAVDCFFNRSFPNSNSHGTFTSEANMKRKKNFTDAGWDFGNVWSIDESRSYPYFQWEKWLWTGSGDAFSWDDPENWNKHDGFPLSDDCKVFINTAEANITTIGTSFQLGGLQLGSGFNKKLTLGHNLLLDSESGYEGSLCIYNGTLEAGTRTLTIDGGFYRSSTGLFDRGTGTVIFGPDTAYPSFIEGSTVFRNFSCTTPGKRLSFEAGSLQTIEGTFTITGGSGNDVALLSNLRGVTWEIRPLGAKSVSYAIVQDSRNISSEPINAGNSIDYGNNINWLFTDYAIEIYTGRNGYVNTREGDFYLSTAEGGTISLMVSPEAPSYYISDVKIDGISTTESLYHPGTPHIFTFNNIMRFYTFEAVFRGVGAKEWDGGGDTYNWSDPLNWAGNSTPEMTDIVKFNSLSTKNASIDASFTGTVAGVSIESGYTGTIRQNSGLTINGSFEQSSGYFICTTPTTSAFTVTRNFSITTADASFIRYTGSGTSTTAAYVVYDIYGLQAMKCNLNKHFKLNFDITADATSNWNWNASTGTREGFSPIGGVGYNFTGSLNGNSFMVKGLYIDRYSYAPGDSVDNAYNVGLFGVLGSGAQVFDLGMKNSSIRGFYNVGVLAGTNNDGKVFRCMADGGNVKGDTYIGGLVGTNSATIEDSYSKAAVEGWHTSGGLMGYNSGSVNRCYAAGVLLNGNPLGFVGSSMNSVINCYYSTLESQRSGDNFGASSLTPVQMKRQGEFVSWNFDTVWTIDEDKSYPSLIWEIWNWTGLGDTTTWATPENWNKKSGYPSTSNDKVYINTGTGTIITPSGDLHIGSLIIGPNFPYNLNLNGDVYLGDSGPREGSLLMLGGTISSAQDRKFHIDGRFKRTNGNFAYPNSNTVIFTGNGISTIEGSTTFYNLYCTKEAKTLIFSSGTVQTIEGTLRLSGEAANKVSLKSTIAGSPWYINPTGTRETPYFISVKDSTNLSSESINPLYSLDLGNNINWFAPYVITAEVSGIGTPDASTWGTIEPKGIISAYHGTTESFRMYSNYGYKMIDVKVDGVPQGLISNYTFSPITANHSIEAIYAIRPFFITTEVTGNGSGTITPSGTIEVGHYQKQIFTFEASAGSYIAYVKVDGVVTREGLENPSYYPSPYHLTFESTSTDHTIEAHFLPEKYYIWSGLGTTEKWSESANWTGNVTPDADSTAIFNGLSTKNASVDADFQGTIKNISMEAGYLPSETDPPDKGMVVISRIFTVESSVSIESGVLRQSTHEMYVRGNWYCSGEGAAFTSEAAVYFNGSSGTQLIYPRNCFFYDLVHIGSGKVTVTDEAIFILNDFLNSSGSGTFELYGVGMLLGGDFTNSSIFTQEVVIAELGNILIYFGGAGEHVLDTGGTGEGKSIYVIFNEGSLRLANSLETAAIVSAGTFDAGGYDVHISGILQNGGTNVEFFKNSGTLYIGTAPDILRQLVFGGIDGSIIEGPVRVKNLSCKVPSKYLLFSGCITIEADGFVTMEGGSTSTPEFIFMGLSEDSGHWYIDPQCPNPSRSFKNLYVENSYNINSATIETTNSIDGGNNIMWRFSTYLIREIHNAGGTVEPIGLKLVEDGTTVTYEVRSDSGYYIGYILKDGLPVTNEGSYLSPYKVTFEAVSSNHTIEAYFDRVGGRTWTGNGTTNNWSEAANWSGNLVPLSTEEVVFSSVGTKDSTIDSSFGGTIGGISIESGYTGTITQARHLTVSSTFEQNGGRFISPAPTYGFTVEGSFKIPDTAQAFTRFGGANPYIIYDIYGLQAMKSYKTASFELNNNISAESTSRWDLSSGGYYQGFDPVGNATDYFMGSLDGKGFIISGLRIKRAQNNVGLFGTLSSGLTIVISQVGIINASVEGTNNVGILAGTNNATITRAYTKGSVIGTGSNIGGMVGNNSSYVGNSYSTANVYGGSVVGGLIGYNTTVVTEGYATGSVSGTTAGGFAGANAGTITNCHFTDSANNNGLGSLETTAQIKQRNRFSNWDFDRTWTIDEAKASPQLMWEIYTWTGSADGTSWTNPNNWNKKSGYPSTKEHKAFINSGVSFSTPVGSQLDLGGMQVGPDYAGTLTMGGTLNLDNSGTREGSLIILGGTLATNNQNIYISGNFKKAAGGTYTTSTGDTIFTSEAASLIEGSTTFSDVTCNVPGKRLTFEAGTIQTIEGTFTISGEAGRWVSFESSATGSKFKINPSGTKSIYFVSVKDSTNESANVLDPGGSNLNLGNTSRWFTYYIYATKEAHGIITPEGTRAVTITTTEPTTYTITTEAGYYVFDVKVDNVSQGALTSYSFSDIRASHTIEVLVTTEARITEEPKAFRVNISGSDIVLSWNAVPMATEYRIYRSANKFAPIITGWASVGATNSLTWTDTNATISTTEAYYIVRAFNSGGESGNSSMGVYKKLSFVKNTDNTNYIWVSIPYNTPYNRASDIVTSIEGGTGAGTNTKIDQIGLWVPGTQTAQLYSYNSGQNRWPPLSDFAIPAGRGVYLYVTASFTWEMAGVDSVATITLEATDTDSLYYNFISLPYTSSYEAASDIVTEIEGGTGAGTNTKIDQIGLWVPGTQAAQLYSYNSGQNRWPPLSNFTIPVGGGIYIHMSGGVSTYNWTPGLKIPPRE